MTALVKVQVQQPPQDNKRYVCEKCSLVFKHKEMHRRHMNVHAEKFKCHTCGKFLQSNYYLISSNTTSGTAAAS